MAVGVGRKVDTQTGVAAHVEAGVEVGNDVRVKLSTRIRGITTVVIGAVKLM